MIEVKELSRKYGEFKAVDDVSFQIEHGEVVGLLGHNGAGKTTIMKMLTGYLEPTTGTALIDGLEIGKDKQKIQRKIGYLPENCPLWSEMKVVDFLDFQATLHGISENDKPQVIRNAISRTGLLEKADQAINTLSRGYRQRVGVAQAILHKPKIIILDEPTNGLDPTQIRHMRSLIQELAQEATVIISTHILQEVQAVCKRVMILHSGKLVVDSNLEDLQNQDQLHLTIDKKGADILEKIPGVKDVNPLPIVNGKHSYIINAAPDVAPVITSTLVNSQIKVYAIYPGKQDLETVFAKVNSGELVEEKTK
ncbi:MAG: ABC transporter ATP-binding protein [Magnetococcales bacterium]|nr:ABC transporter ATP-binding protein [Magnetococcales bacterium]